MPKEVEECVRAVQREHGYSESRAYSICVAAYKKKHGKNPKMKGFEYMDLQKEFRFEIPIEVQKGKDGELQVFGGIASSSSIDRDYDRIDPLCLDKMSKDLVRNPTVFFNHDHKGLAVGKISKAEVKEGNRLWIDVEPSKAAGVKDIVTQINEGILRGFSIGGKVKSAETEYNKDLGRDVRVVKDVELFEVSVVGIPANPDASIMTAIAKAWGEPVTDEEIKTAEPYIQKDDMAMAVSGGSSSAPATGTAGLQGDLIQPGTGGGPSSKQSGPGTKDINDKATLKPSNEGGPKMSNAHGQPTADEGARHDKEGVHVDLSTKCPHCGKDVAKKSEPLEVSDDVILKVVQLPEFKKVMGEYAGDLKKMFEEQGLALKAAQARIVDLETKAFGTKRQGMYEENEEFKEPEKAKKNAKEMDFFGGAFKASKLEANG